MKTALILLIGEQPIPNLLPVRHLKPDVAVLVHTGRTKDLTERLKPLLSCRCLLCPVDPYHLPEIQNTLQNFLNQKKLPKQYQLLFNLTGGTKPMSLAAFQVAFQHRAPFVYFQTEGGRSLLFHYQFTDRGIVQSQKQEISTTITLDDYLRAQVGDYTTESQLDPFEQQVHEALKAIADLEILTSVRPQKMAALEVDFVIRLGNQVGVVEVKTKGAKSGIDQIQAVAEQRYLGTYVAKFLVSGKPVDRNNKILAKAYNIEVIEVPTFVDRHVLSENDKEELKRRILEKLKGGS